MSATDQLIELLRDSNVRVTLDLERTTAGACYHCKLPGPHDLAEVGTYGTELPPGSSLRPGDPIIRPVCTSCKATTTISEKL